MGTKTISVTEDVYETLKRMKLEGESFSDTIRHLAGRGILSECAGLWSDMSEEDFKKINAAIAKLRARGTRDLPRRLETH